MRIELAKTAGFCFGVDRAVKIAYECAGRADNTYTYGMLIHNRSLTEELREAGIGCIERIEDIPRGASVIVRAHGISKAEYDALTEKGINIIDATCPYVKKIHKIVEAEYKAGKKILIVGDKNHPEVKGINGWCDGSAFISSDVDEIFDFLEKSRDSEVSAVAQTTVLAELLKKIREISKKHFTNVKFFDTICNATNERQSEAERLATDADIVFVIGSSESSNTNNLWRVCAAQCANTFKIENNKELKNYKHLFKNDSKVAITAGASTPQRIIKEVFFSMSEITNSMNFEEALEETLKPLNTGDIVKGVVIGITPTDVQVDIGSKYDGYIPVDELSNDPGVNPADVVKIGEEVDVFVILVSDRDGNVKLSKKKIDVVKGMREIEAAYESGEILTGRVVEIVRGGVVTIAKGVRVFIPASEASERFLEDLGTLLNTEVSFRIINIDDGRRRGRRVVGSIKTVAREQRQKLADEFWANAEVGKKYTGEVKSLTNFGAFVDLGGVDGLIHISELSNVRIKHPSEAVSVGDTIDVYIRELDREHNKVSLVRELKEEKEAAFWAGAEVGKVYQGVVKSLTNFGAFVDLGGVDGLVHISELSWNRVKHPSEVVSVGDTIEVFIKALDPETKKVSLGYRKEEDSPWTKSMSSINVGDVIKCKIVRILPFGAFAEIAPGVDGLIHISQIANTRIAKPSDVLNIGDEVEAKVLDINNDTKQVALSIKATLPEEGAAPVDESGTPTSYVEEDTFTLGDILDSHAEAEAAEEPEAKPEEKAEEKVEEKAEEEAAVEAEPETETETEAE